MNQSVSEANGILMKDFNKLIKEINYILESIKKNNENIKQLNRDYEKATLTSKEKGNPFIIIVFIVLALINNNPFFIILETNLFIF